MRVLRALVLLLCLAMGAGAQLSHAPKGPSSREQKETLARVKASLAEYEQHIPAFVCTQLWKPEELEGMDDSGDRRSSVIADLEVSERGKQNATPTAFDVEPLIRDLFTSNAKFVFARWAKVHRKRVAVYHYKKKSRNGVRQAEIYADQVSGTVARIVFQEQDTPEHVPLFCRVEQK